MKTKIISPFIIPLIFLLNLFSPKAYSQITLYGLNSSGGGCCGSGNIFSITPTGNYTIFSNLIGFGAVGINGTLLYASDGNFYGLTTQGGYNDGGTAYKCNSSGIVSIVLNFDTLWSTDAQPYGGNSLIQAMDGNIYGMTTFGGANDYGVIFRYNLSGNYTALHFFNDTNGRTPYCSLIQTPDSVFWGMTAQGGTDSVGIIFYFTPSGGLTKMHDFIDSTDGSAPFGDLLYANDSNFYGLTSAGGKYGDGTLFRFTRSGVFTKLIDFNDTNGSSPYASLMQASDGNLYGETYRGGQWGAGTLFKCTLSGTLTTIVEFNDTNGTYPEGTLMEASDGNLYGTTYLGGDSGGYGTIFQYSLPGDSLTVLKNLNFNTTGYGPLYGKLVEADNFVTGEDKSTEENEAVKVFPNPSNGIFTIALSHSELVSESQTIEIYNVLGAKVYYATLKQVQGDYEINLSSQPNGIYFYRVLDEDGSLIGEGKLVIEK